MAAMQAAFNNALVTCPRAISEHYYTVSNLCIRLRIVGRTIAQELTPPFEHLENAAAGKKPDLTVDVWDQQETGVKGTSAGKSNGEHVLSVLMASPEGRYVVEERSDRISWLDRRTCHVVSCIRCSDILYVDERARPLTRLLGVWFNDRDIQLIHSSLVSWESRGVAFVGKGGVGKSTSSIACLEDGFGYLGHDIIGLKEEADGSFSGFGIYASCLLTPQHLTRFPDLMPHAFAGNYPHEEKSFVYLSRVFPERMEQKTTINVVALPRVVDTERTSFRPASKGEALLALAPTSVMYLAASGRRSIDNIGKLVERVPCYWLDLGRDLNSISDTVRRMVAATEQA